MLLLAGKRIGDPKAGWLATTMMALAFVWSVVMLIALLSLPGDERTQRPQPVHLVPGREPQGVTSGSSPIRCRSPGSCWSPGSDRMIHLYAIGYMRGDERYARFFAYFNLFAAAMLVLVLALELPPHLPRVGGRRPLLVPARRVLVRADAGVERVAQGVRHQPRRRLRLHDRDVLHRGRARQPRLLGDERRAPAASRRRRRRRSRCCSSSAASARARRSVCTSGCPTRWKAPRRCRR